MRLRCPSYLVYNMMSIHESPMIMRRWKIYIRSDDLEREFFQLKMLSQQCNSIHLLIVLKENIMVEQEPQ